MKKLHGQSKKRHKPFGGRSGTTHDLARLKDASPQMMLRAIALHQAGELDKAEAAYRALLASHPDDAMILCSIGIVCAQRKNWKESAYLLAKSISLKSDYADSHYYHSVALTNLSRHDDALASSERAILLNSNYVEAYYIRGRALHDLKRYDDAVASYEKAIAINSHYTEAYNNLGVAFNAKTQYDDAIANYDKAIALDQGYAEAYYNRGVAFCGQGRYSDAAADYDNAIALSPNYAKANWNKGLLKLLLGEYEEGWRLFEWRWKQPGLEFRLASQKPLWLGQEPLIGKTILLHAEQGAGDTIQFCRYVRMVEALGAKVILAVPSLLETLMATLKGSFDLLGQGIHNWPHDFRCPLMSLPLALGTTLATVPANVPYLFASRENIEIWQKRLGAKTKPRIGLVWSGAREHKNDHNRSIPLTKLTPLLRDTFDFHSLQIDVRPSDAAAFDGNSIANHADLLKDFADTAGLISEMDLVISVDTSVAHLAGALGKLVWILLPFSPDFRWLLDRNDCPWYPSARLFRQPTSGDWDAVILKVQHELSIALPWLV